MFITAGETGGYGELSLPVNSGGVQLLVGQTLCLIPSGLLLSGDEFGILRVCTEMATA